ncbi:MAG: NADH:ubiquinone oxidoreductase subunit 4 (subunit M), partial [Sphingobacteriales bacterium]
MGILTLIIFLPLLGIPLILALPNSAADFSRWICAGISLIQLIICAILFFNFQAAETTEIASISSYQYVESI